MNAMNDAARAAECAGRVRRLIETGVIGAAGDEAALLALLDGCRTRAEVDAVRRAARRWEYATEPVPPWVDWRTELEATRN